MWYEEEEEDWTMTLQVILDTVIRRYNYRIYPDEDHIRHLNREIGANRFIWNYFRREAKLAMRTGVLDPNYIRAAKFLTLLKQESRYRWLCDVSISPLQQTLRHLTGTLSTHLSGKGPRPVGFPKRKKKGFSGSFTHPAAYHVDRTKGLLYLPKMMKDPIRIRLHRVLPEDSDLVSVKSVTITRETDGSWYASFVVHSKTPPRKLQYSESNISCLGVDLGCADAAVLSDGSKFPNPRHQFRIAKRLETLGQLFSKKKKGSRRWHRLRLMIARLQMKLRNQRKDFAHKVSHKIANDNHHNGVAMETLDVTALRASMKKMSGKPIVKSSIDAMWGKITEYTKYKTETLKKLFIQAPSGYPSTQICSTCRCRGSKKDLSIRSWRCTACGSTHDRDVNASLNLAYYGDVYTRFRGAKWNNETNRIESMTFPLRAA